MAKALDNITVIIIIIVLTTTLLSTHYSHFTGKETDAQGLKYLVRVTVYNWQSQHGDPGLWGSRELFLTSKLYWWKKREGSPFGKGLNGFIWKWHLSMRLPHMYSTFRYSISFILMQFWKVGRTIFLVIHSSLHMIDAQKLFNFTVLANFRQYLIS